MIRTSGTDRDNAGHVPPPDMAGKRDRQGHTPKGCPVSRPCRAKKSRSQKGTAFQNDGLSPPPLEYFLKTSTRDTAKPVMLPLFDTLM